MSTRQPRLLSASFGEKRRLKPTAMSVTLELMGISTATVTLEEGDAAVAMHDWIEVYTPRGSAGIFRVTNIENTMRQQRVLTLMHAIDTLSDSVWVGQTDYDGTVSDFLTQLLAQQPVRRWQLGTCSDRGAWKKSGINYDRLSDLLEEVRSNRFGYMFTYDFTTSPWTLNFIKQPTAIASEFRLARNVENCRITFTDGEQCNRLYLSVNHRETDDELTVTETEIKTYNNTDSQATYGIIAKTADIDLEDVPDADAWAEDFLAQRAEPMAQISVDGYALRQITGVTWDEAELGKLSRVALPDYGLTIVERAVSIHYPELLFGDGIERVTVELANHLQKFSETLANTQKQARAAGKAARSAGRGGGGGGGGSSVLESWAVVLSKHKETIEGSGLSTLYESGITVDPQEGVVIHSLAEGFVSQHAEIKINSNKITQIVSAVGTNGEVTAASIVLAINTKTGSSVTISADKIYLQGDTSVDNLLSSQFTALRGKFDNLIGGLLLADKLSATTINASHLVIPRGGDISFQEHTVKWKSMSNTTYVLSAEANFMTNTGTTIKGKLVTGTNAGTTLYYLGRD